MVETESYRPRRFGVIESDIEIDYVNRTVKFSNEKTIWKTLCLEWLIPLSIIVAVDWFCVVQYSAKMTYDVIMIQAIIGGLSLVVIAFAHFTQTPTFLNFMAALRAKLHMPKKPNFTYEIENPSRFKLHIGGAFRVLCSGECKDLRKALRYSEKTGVLEMEFVHSCSGKVVVEEYIGGL